LSHKVRVLEGDKGRVKPRVEREREIGGELLGRRKEGKVEG